MQIDVTDRAVACLKDEWGFAEGEQVRLYVRYAGGGSDPYALGILKEQPSGEEAFRTIAGGIVFYIEERDVWFLQGKRLTIDARGEELLFLLEE